ncbi:MAG: T9SS type A sorting domain-containing protein [Bacteroidales bacterium]|nr:T9SS type A sorting domain-containing protein [Bacteroidales bacterium]
MKTKSTPVYAKSLFLIVVFLFAGLFVQAQRLQLAKKSQSVNRAAQVLNQDVLFDNGPFVTDSGGGQGGSNLSVLQDITLGMDYPGFGAGITQNHRVADDFIIPVRWKINAFDFFVYQSGSTTTPTINQMNLRIWNGVPDENGSEVVWGDAYTDIFTSASWTECYRVSESLPGMTVRPVMKVTAQVSDITLDPGTYWIDVQFGGTLSAEPSVVPITIVGENTTGNSLQKTGSNWYNIEDVGQQGIPFIIWGEPVECNPPTSLIGTNVYYSQYNYGAEICWNDDSGTYISEWLYYDDGVNVDGVGGEASFMWAIKFDPSQLEDFEGTSLTKIKIYNRTSVANELRIYEGTNAATLLHTQTLSGLPVEAWSEVNLSSSVAIDITKQLWIAVYTNDGANYPAGCGNGMNEPNGDLISFDGSNWEHLTDFNMDNTWTLRAYVTNATGETVRLTSDAISGLGSSNKTNLNASKANRAISGFNIYRHNEINYDYVLLTNVPVIPGTTHYCYVDMEVELGGSYYYQVTALYLDSLNQECESIPALSLINPNDNYVWVLITDGIEDLDIKSVMIYPNPATENVTIESKNMNYILVTNTLGQRVYDAVFQNAKKVVLDIEDYEAGVYVVRIETANGTVSKRFTVVR